MKYSQAILVACVGGASLASAMPAGEHHGTPLPKSRSQRYGKAIGKASVIAGTFAKTATGNNYPVNEYADTTSGTLKKRGPLSRLDKARVVKAAHKGKELGNSAVTAAGGSSALAENAGSVFNLIKENTQPSYPPLSGRDSISVSSRELEDDLEARLFDRLKSNYYNRKAESLNKEAAKATAVAGVYGNGGAAPVVGRELIDELEARDVDLETRLFDRLKSNYYNRKAESLNKEAAKATAVAGVYGNTGAAPAVYKREFLHELDARDVAEYLEARGKFLNALGALKDTITGKNRVPSMPAADPYAPVARDLSEDVEARDFDLDSRDFDFEIDELD